MALPLAARRVVVPSLLFPLSLLVCHVPMTRSEWQPSLSPTSTSAAHMLVSLLVRCFPLLFVFIAKYIPMVFGPLKRKKKKRKKGRTFESFQLVDMYKFVSCYVYRGFRTRMVYLDCLTCLRYTILARNPRYFSPQVGQASVHFLN